MSAPRRHRSSDPSSDSSPLLALPAPALALVAQLCGPHGGALRTTCKRLTLLVDTSVRQLKVTPRNGAALVVAAPRFPSCCALTLEGWPGDLTPTTNAAFATLKQLLEAAATCWPNLASMAIRPASTRPLKPAALDAIIQHLSAQRTLSELTFSCFDLDSIAGLAPLAPSLQALTLGPLAKPHGTPAAPAAAGPPAAQPAHEPAAGGAAAAPVSAAAAAEAHAAAASAPPTGLATLQQLTSLTRLSLGLEKLGAAADVAALSRLTQLQTLSVRATLPEFDSLLLSLAPLTSLRTLEVHGRKRGLFPWRGEPITTSLVKGLAGHNALSQLHLLDMEVDSVGLQALATLPALSVLSLGMLHAERSCRAALTALTALTVVNSECVQQPLSALFPALKHFDCGAGGLWEVARDRALVIQHHAHISHLSICWPLIRVVWMVPIPDPSWLATLPSLTSLHAYTANNATVTDVMAGVTLLTGLRALQIHAPGFDDACAKMLVEHVPALRQLSIRGSNCGITDDGMSALATLPCLSEREVLAAPGVTADGLTAACGASASCCCRKGMGRGLGAWCSLTSWLDWHRSRTWGIHVSLLQA